MSHSASSRQPPEPPPQNDLERLMRKAADDPGLHGRVFRMLWDSDLYTYIPDHPEMHGARSLQNGDKLRFTVYEHREGPFIAVFTSEAAAHWAGAHFPSPKPAIARLPAQALFKTVNDGTTWVRINHQLRCGMTLEPEGVDALVQGEYTHSQPPMEKQEMTLHPVP
ncbi:MAG TPA: SseB family protein, partial [Chthoniobacteraceae bacterium]|nr:SseB family protein [Chthoniobacteraceae bacterium]